MVFAVTWIIAIVPANVKLPVTKKDIKKVAQLPVILQLTVLAKLLLVVSFTQFPFLCES